MRLFLFGILALIAIQNASMNVTLPPSSCANSTDILAVLNNLPGCITESFLTNIATGMVYTSQQFVNSAIGFLTASPDPHWFCSPYTQVMALLESLYSIALMGVGLYYILQAADVEGRVRAKMMLKDIFFMIVILTFSFYLFDMLLSLNQYIATSLITQSVASVFNANMSFASLIFALVIIGGLLFTAGITFFTLLIRYLLIPFLLLLFPISIFLYFMPFGKAWGGAFLKIIAIIVFMTAIDAVFIAGLASLFSSPDPNLLDSFVKSMAIILGFGLVGIINIALFVIAILSVIEPVLQTMGPLKWIALPMIYAAL